jgi:hypothetical protein
MELLLFDLDAAAIGGSVGSVLSFVPFVEEQLRGGARARRPPGRTSPRIGSARRYASSRCDLPAGSAPLRAEAGLVRLLSRAGKAAGRRFSRLVRVSTTGYLPEATEAHSRREFVSETNGLSLSR